MLDLWDWWPKERIVKLSQPLYSSDLLVGLRNQGTFADSYSIVHSIHIEHIDLMEIYFHFSKQSQWAYFKSPQKVGGQNLIASFHSFVGGDSLIVV